MELRAGEILEGKITGITKFGAFVALPNGKTGMVHISEVANTYVSDITEHLSEGQQTQVKVISIDEQTGRINLSIKKALPQPERRPVERPRQTPPRSASPGRAAAAAVNRSPAASAPATFEDKLKQFMADSDSKISGIRQYSDKRSSSRRKSK